MKQGTLMLTMVAFATLLLASGIGTAVAEPQKNQILVPGARCNDGEQRTFVINGEGNVGHINESTEKNIIIATSSFTFFAPEDEERTEPIADPVIVNNGKKKGLQGDLIRCWGEVPDIELFRLGKVTVVYDFQGFVTPRGNR